MSYSVCFDCAEMVSGYEKYCEKCVKRKKPGANDLEFWKKPESTEIFRDTDKRLAELKKDERTI